MEVRIFLTNLAEYNRGNLTGKWVDLPMDEEELLEELEDVLNMGEPGDEEYFITDFEPRCLGIGEYENLNDLNELVEEIQDIDEDILIAMLEDFDLEESVSIIQSGDYGVYYGVNDMKDVAMEIVEELGYLDGLPSNLQYYFDYDKFGRDLEIEGYFIFHPTKSICVEIIR
jgi:antirestriction protein